MRVASATPRVCILLPVGVYSSVPPWCEVSADCPTSILLLHPGGSTLGSNYERVSLLSYLSVHQNGAGPPLKERLDITEEVIKQRHDELAELQSSLSALKGRKSPRTKATLLDTIEQVERTLDSLEAQHNRLADQLNTLSLSAEEIKSIEEYAAEIAKDLDNIRYDFDGRRRMIELLDVRISLLVEDGQKWVDVECRLLTEPKRLPIVNKTINNMLSQSILCEVGYGYSGVDVIKKIGSDSYTLGKYPSRMTLSCKLAQKSL